jgi:urocanate hydratase
LVHDSASAATGSLPREVCGFYHALTRNASLSASADSGAEPNLGGKLLYAGELDAMGRAFVMAGNVAGCATLSATADSEAQKQSIRDGVVDFLVTSLDEALRILKNEIRQHKSVAVCVGVSPQLIEHEMLQRGVQPDLVSAAHQKCVPAQFGPAVHPVQCAEPSADQAFLSWRVPRSAARWMAKIDALALDCLDSHPWEKRWIRLSPRYLGRSAFAERSICCDAPTATQIAGRIASAVQQAEVDAEVSMSLNSLGETLTWNLSPYSAQSPDPVKS